MNPSILVVDDEKDIRDLLRMALVANGYNVETAGNGQEALEMMQEVLPHAIVLDLMMPRMTGFEVVDAMRDGGVLSEVPVIILTARDLDQSDYQRLEGTWAIYMKGTMDLNVLVEKFTSALAA